MQRVLLISNSTPFSGSSGNSSRLAMVVRGLKRLGAEVHFVHVARRIRGRIPCDLPLDSFATIELVGHPPIAEPCPKLLHEMRTPSRLMPLRCYDLWRQRRRDVASQLQGLVHHRRIDTLWVDQSCMAPLIRDLPRDATQLRVVDTHNVMYQRDESLIESGLRSESDVTREEEQQLLEDFDLVLAIQDREREVLQQMLPERAVTTLRYGTSIERQPSRNGNVCFVGSGYHVNEHGLEQFLKLAWPAIREACPDSKLELVGGVADGKAARAAAAAGLGIVRHGVVDEIGPYYDGPAVVICPLWAGSGLKIKLAESLSFGKATVASPVAAQGLEDGIGQAFELAKRAEDFVEPVIRLIQDKSRRETLEAAAADYARRMLSDEAVWSDFLSFLAQRRAIRNGEEGHLGSVG